MPELSGGLPLLLCEGLDDEQFLRWVVEREHISTVQIANLRGKDPLREKVLVRLSEIPGRVIPPAVGVVLDADGDPKGRMMSIQNVLNTVAPNVRHGVYVLPRPDEQGMLEDLCLMAGRHAGLIECATQFAECAKAKHSEAFNVSKARYDAYASVVRPTRMGVRPGFNDNEIDVNHPAMRLLIQFLRDFASVK